jgi:DNA-binding GntR family transcriptional regulator
MILEAIRSGNAEKARQSMSAHILSSSKDLQSQLAVNKTPKGGRVL